jgi:hypothetical protein
MFRTMPFEEGKSGNPGGRPKRKLTYDALMVELKSREDGTDPRGLRKIVATVVDLAEGGERWATEFIRDTTDGKPTQAIEGDLTVSADHTITGLLTRIAAEGKRLGTQTDDEPTT